MKFFFLSNIFDEPHLLFIAQLGGVGRGRRDGMGGEGEKKRRGVWRGAPKMPNQVFSAVSIYP